MRLKRRTLLGATAATFTLAGCLGSDNSSDEPATNSDDENDTDDGYSLDDEKANDPAGPTVQVLCHCDHDPILVGPTGQTLYMFDQDTQGEGASACYEDCAENWPPLTVEDEPTVGNDVEADVTTFEREDGSMQVAANGWPLYYFTPDEALGDIEGQGVNDVWWVLNPAGEPITDLGSHSHDGDVPESPSENAEVAMVSDDGHYFNPHVVWIKPGGTVTWTLESGGHTTTAYHADVDKPQRIPDDAESWDSGILDEEGQTFEQTFDVEGVYDYFCQPHEGMGMVGSVIVGEPDSHEQPVLEPPQEDLPDGAREALEQLNDTANETLGHTHE
ncbi:plastocyanin/azurin family copper-binding protein [Natronococcus jeotgali]|uniref:Blue (Type 1) copper domain-containing protein n=1 Tax=Natronococcus jeotgali DSM 18795 TaxID=1227498 RepID=L9XLY0_9EURY|nr:plastocyanin/azurin family copper-binding protein [Natronococcus jeotgali]ELY61668.1 blue (type 1) copper domain-containing protein [Natronococcus jeotgali DSM 18795]